MTILTTELSKGLLINNLWHAWAESQGVFKGQLFDLTDALGRVGWVIDAGGTSNYEKSYKLDGVLITREGHMVPYIWQETSRGNFLVPCLINQDLVAIGNYGTPQRANTLEEAVDKWNSEYPHEYCVSRVLSTFSKEKCANPKKIEKNSQTTDYSFFCN